MERNEMNLRERWEKQNNSVKLLMKKLRRHDTFVVTVAVVIALVLCGGLIYMSTPVVAASARDQVVEKENKNNEKTTEKLDELHNYLTDIDKMIVKNQKGIDSYYEKTNNDRFEGDKTTDAVKEFCRHQTFLLLIIPFALKRSSMRILQMERATYIPEDT